MAHHVVEFHARVLHISTQLFHPPLSTSSSSSSLSSSCSLSFSFLYHLSVCLSLSHSLLSPTARLPPPTSRLCSSRLGGWSLGRWSLGCRDPYNPPGTRAVAAPEVAASAIGASPAETPIVTWDPGSCRSRSCRLGRWSLASRDPDSHTGPGQLRVGELPPRRLEPRRPLATGQFAGQPINFYQASIIQFHAPIFQI